VAPAVVEEAAADVSPLAVPTGEVVTVDAQPGEVAPVVLVWTGIGDLHKGFFTTEDILARLASDLHPHLSTAAQVHIRFDSRGHTGWIQLQLKPESLRPKVEGPDGLVHLQAMAPITTALARFRDAVAGRYDMRVGSFHVGIEANHGMVRCVFGVTGTPPPDGRQVSQCVTVNGTEHCGVAQEYGLRFDAGVAATIRQCLR